LEPVLIFVNALCIDQSHGSKPKAERDAQVKLMRKVYPAAECVFVDPGDEFNDSNAAIYLLERFCDINDDDWQGVGQGQIKADQFKIFGSERTGLGQSCLVLQQRMIPVDIGGAGVCTGQETHNPSW
jgi:hypothetical protein